MGGFSSSIVREQEGWGPSAMSHSSYWRCLKYAPPQRYAALTSFALIKLFTREAQLHRQWTPRKERLRGSFALDSWFCVSKALNSKTSGLLTPIRASAPRAGPPPADALTPKALVLSSSCHRGNCRLGRRPLYSLPRERCQTHLPIEPTMPIPF